MDTQAIDAATEQILNSRKYRGLEIPRETITDLFAQEIEAGSSPKQAIKEVKAKLHNIMAPYLDRLDYAAEISRLKDFAAGKTNEKLEEICTTILQAHDSTRERLPYCQDFFDNLFSKTGAEGTVLDLACGLNPFFLPLVDVPEKIQFKAFDIHGPRIALLNSLFEMIPAEGEAIRQDILVQPPREKAKAALLFKEAHRIEKREHGASRKLIESLQAEMILVSLPTHSLNGRFDLRERMARLVEEMIDGLAKLEETREFDAEMVYLIRKRDG